VVMMLGLVVVLRFLAMLCGMLQSNFALSWYRQIMRNKSSHNTY